MRTLVAKERGFAKIRGYAFVYVYWMDMSRSIGGLGAGYWMVVNHSVELHVCMAMNTSNLCYHSIL